jgi:hypothetical protein
MLKEYQMNANSFETREKWLQDQEMAQNKVDDRRGLLGFIALISLAIPALLIRALLPDLNPLILAGLGVVVYSAYLAVMVTFMLRQVKHEQPAPKTVPVMVDKE